MLSNRDKQFETAKKTLHLIIFPTEKCNFRCTYCYEDFLIGKMKQAKQDAIKKLVTRRAEAGSLDRLMVSWFGGEPLVARKEVYYLSSYFQEMYSNGLIKGLSGNTTTNGYFLTPEVLEKLCSFNQREFQISLDGLAEGHDVTRRHASGRGTFDVIWRNLKAAKDTRLTFKIMLRLHLTKSNIESMRALVSEIAASFHDDPRFSVFFKPIENLGGAGGGAVDPIDEAEAHRVVAPLIEQLRYSGIFAAHGIGLASESQTVTYSETEGSLSGSEGTSVATPYVCYASKPNSLVIRADGRVGKCTVMLDDDRNTVGEILDDGSLRLDPDKLTPWFRGFQSNDPAELGCPANGLPPVKEQVISLASLKSGEATALQASG